jgi:hypothetical protein
MSPFVALLLGGGYWSPIDVDSPNAVGTLQARMLSLSEGMTEFEVDKRLGLENQGAYMLGGTMNSRFRLYYVGQAHVLSLSYRCDCKRDTWILARAVLHVDWDRLDPPEATPSTRLPYLNIFPFSSLTPPNRRLD